MLLTARADTVTQNPFTRRYREVSMSTPTTCPTGQQHIDDLVREAHHRRHHDKVRRLAVIVSAGPHFRLVPTRAWPDGTER